MVTVDEETQAKEFLKRAEIRTMRKDLLSLREVDALVERDKIATLKTLEEQLEEKRKTMVKTAGEKAGLEEVLQKNEGQERIAEKDLKNYATEQERQQIFLFESQRLDFEKQADLIDKEKDPALKLEKNKLLLLKRDQQAKLNSILDEEKNLETEQKFTIEKEQSTTIDSQKRSLEQSRGEIETKIQEVEKRRWAVEKEIEATDAKVSEIDKSSDQLVAEKNILRDKILGADKSLREIYFAVMAREEEKRRGEAQEQIARREAISKAKAISNESVQRQQWTHSAPPVPSIPTRPTQIPIPVKRGSARIFNVDKEEEQRKQFLKDVELGVNKEQGSNQQKNIK